MAAAQKSCELILATLATTIFGRVYHNCIVAPEHKFFVEATEKKTDPF